MQTQVKAWGNSQGIRLPKDILQEANVEINDMHEDKSIGWYDYAC